MSNNEDFFNEDPLDGLSDADKILLEERIIEDAFYNSYLVITERCTFAELIETYAAGDASSALMAHDPDSGPKKDTLINMILHYSSPEYEEYERCAELLVKLHSLFPETVGKELI